MTDSFVTKKLACLTAEKLCLYPNDDVTVDNKWTRMLSVLVAIF